ncbi:putative methyltransferase [Nitrososphaera viennensis EN76]|uniref:Putative methyltransferase n=1 Tax=Nitrososphaera viennensis EN76 TaxID=926571 RepID=A0A060HCW0_9ARCH|nr:putative methyltransferase [Nitrososphaera viennensis EN76]
MYGVWVAHVGRRTGLFEAIARRPATPEELAAQANFNADAVKAWCSAALALGFLKMKSKKLYLPAKMKEILLDKKSPDYLGGQFSYIALRSLEYGGLEDLIKTGRTREMTSSTFEAIVEATDWDHNAFLSAIKRGRNHKLHAMLSKGCRALDVGCGTGTFIEKLLQIYQHSSFVGVEPSEAAAHTAMEMAAGLPAVEILRETGEAMNFENEFDLVYLGESLYAASDKQAIVSNCYRALKKGGAIAIVEGLLPDNNNKTSNDDEGRLIMGMQVDFALQGYRFMTRNEIGALLKAAGFSKAAFEDFGGSLYLVTAWKP